MSSTLMCCSFMSAIYSRDEEVAVLESLKRRRLLGAVPLEVFLLCITEARHGRAHPTGPGSNCPEPGSCVMDCSYDQLKTWIIRKGDLRSAPVSCGAVRRVKRFERHSHFKIGKTSPENDMQENPSWRQLLKRSWADCVSKPGRTEVIIWWFRPRLLTPGQIKSHFEVCEDF